MNRVPSYPNLIYLEPTELYLYLFFKKDYVIIIRIIKYLSRHAWFVSFIDKRWCECVASNTSAFLRKPRPRSNYKFCLWRNSGETNRCDEQECGVYKGVQSRFRFRTEFSREHEH